MEGVSPYQLLEINLISAQDISKVSRSMKTYATTWIHSDRKLTTRVDNHGGTNPTWNDKFVFRVDNQFLQSDTSAIMIEIYALHWFRDVHVGTVRVLVSNLIPPHSQNHIGMRFIALQVRRRSGRPQGILNIGVTVLDGTMRSMPLYNSSALGYQKLMGNDGNNNSKGSGGAKLRRCSSDRSSLVDNKPGSSIINRPTKNGFYLNGSDVGSLVIPSKKGEKVFYDKPLSIVDGTNSSDLGLAVKLKAQLGKADSVLSYATSTKQGQKRPNKKNPSIASQSHIGMPTRSVSKQMNVKMVPKKAGSDVGGLKPMNGMPQSANNPIDSHIRKQNQRYAQRYPIAKDFAAGSVWTESEVGPSPSEVAAAIAEDSKYRRGDDGGSSMLDDRWSMDESEGIRTKLDRWRTEMPPGYDDCRSDVSGSTLFAAPKHRRRRANGNGSGKFSCFGNIFGYECTIVCGAPDEMKKKNMKNNKSNKQIVRAPPSIDSVSTYF